MNKTIYNDRIEMNIENDELLQYTLGAGRSIECKQSILWVTRAGDSQDYLLQPGERYIPQSAGKVAIGTFSKAVFIISNN